MLKLNVKMLRADYFGLIGNVHLKDNTVVMVEHDLLNFHVLDTKVEDDIFKFKISCVSNVSKYNDMDMGYCDLNQIMQKFIAIDFGVLDIKGIDAKDEGFRRDDEILNCKNGICSVTYPKGMIEKLEKAGVTDFNRSFYQAIGRAISQRYASFDNYDNNKIRCFNQEALFATIESHMLRFKNKVSNNMNLNDLFHLLIDPIISHPYIISEDEKKFVNSVLDMIYNIPYESPSYSIMKLQNLLYRFSSCNGIILPIILVVNALEMMITESQAHEYSGNQDRFIPFVYYLNKYIRGLAVRNESPYKFGESMFYRFNENAMVAGQSIGSYTTSIMDKTRNESPIIMDNGNKDMKIVTDDNLKTFLYKDIALSLTGIKNRIENMETEDDRKKLAKEVDELANKILDARVRLTDMSSNLIEFDNLDEELRDTKFEITNFNIYSPEAISAKESFGLVAVNDYFSFGEINPYNVNNPTNIKDPLKKVAKRAYVHTENIVVTAVKFIFGVLRRNVEQFGADLYYASKKVSGMFNSLFGKVNLLMGASFPVTSYGATNHSDVIRNMKNKLLDYPAERNKRFKDWQEAKFRAKEKIMSTFTDLTYNEDFPISVEEEYKFVKVPIEFDLASHGEANLLKDIMSKKVRMSFGIKRLLLSKAIKGINKSLKGKKVDKAMKDKLEIENTKHKELMQKALRDKKITKKEYDWFLDNCLYDTKNLKVADTKN